MGTWGSVGRSSHGGAIGLIAVVSGLLGALSSFVLWVYQSNPDSSMMRFVSQDFGVSKQSHDALLVMAAALGGLCVLLVVLTAFGSRPHGASIIVGLILGVIALSYPFAYLAQFVSQPLTHSPIAK